MYLFWLTFSNLIPALSNEISSKDQGWTLLFGCHISVPEKEMLDFDARKFNQDVSPVLYGLVHFDDAERERMPEMVWDLQWVEIKKAILLGKLTRWRISLKWVAIALALV